MQNLKALGLAIALFSVFAVPAKAHNLQPSQIRGIMWSIIATMQRVNPEIASCIGEYSYKARTDNKYEEIKLRIKQASPPQWNYDTIVIVLEEKCGAFKAS